jgi:hypothetical protein
MSDFLSQLAERALARPPLVRPRLQSIYEPPVASVLPNPLEEHVELPAVPPRVIEFAHERTLQSRDEKAGAKQASEESDRKSDESESAGKIKTAEPKTPQHRTARKDDRQLERVPAARARQPATPSEDAKAPSAESDLEIQTPARQKESVQPQTFSHESKSRVEKQPVHPIAVTVRPAQRSRDEQAVPTLPLTPAPREGPPRASAPAVHVTIGRVEVRAIMPGVAAPEPAPSSTPRLSLEDYLKQRNGGARE